MQAQSSFVDNEDDDNLKGFIEISHPSRMEGFNNPGVEERGLLDKVFDLTGEAFEKFGNLFRGESTEKKQEKAPKTPSAHSSILMKSDRGHLKKPSGFMDQQRNICLKVVDVDSGAASLESQAKNQVFNVVDFRSKNPTSRPGSGALGTSSSIKNSMVNSASHTSRKNKAAGEALLSQL